MLKVIGALLLLTFMVTGCSSATENKAKYEVVYINTEKEYRIQNQRDVKKFPLVFDKPYTIAVISKQANVSYYNTVAEGAKEAARDFGVNVLTDAPKINDPDKQIEVIRRMILRKVDAIAVSASDREKLLPVLNEAREKHIRVVTWETDTDPAARDFFINMVDPQTLGQHLMDMLAGSLNEKGEFAILTSSMMDSSSTEWIKWIKIQHKLYYPNMKLVEIVSTNNNYYNALAKTKELNNKYPELSGIIGISYDALPAAAQAVLETGKKGSIKVVGISTPNSIRSHIKKGSAQMITFWSPRKLGYLTVALAKNLLDGEVPYDQQAIPNVGNIRVNGNSVIMGEPIDFAKDNIDQYDF